MEREVSTATLLAVVLLGLAAIIMISFGIFSIGKKSANDGSYVVQSKIEVVEASEFIIYDQTIVSGLSVKDALDKFKGSNVAILIATQAFNDIETGNCTNVSNSRRFTAVRKAYTTDANGAAVLNSSGWNSSVDSNIYLNIGKGYANNKALADSLVIASGSRSCKDTYTMTTTNNKSVIGAFINYNALLDDGGSDTGDTRVCNLGFNGGQFRCDSGFDIEKDIVLTNMSKLNINKPGTFEYVSDSARFNSYLIKDLSGVVLGVAFIQIPTV